MKILGTGLNGLVGSRIIELLSSQYEFESISRSNGVDITQKDSVFAALKDSPATIVLHMAAKTQVDGCEEDKPQGVEGEAWKINVGGTQSVVDACQELNKKLIYVSTDFVFDGEKEGSYVESDAPHPINWYGQTKYEGEKIVSTLENSVIVRVAYPYRANFEKKDFVRAIIARLSDNQETKVVEDHIFCPTFIDDIAHALDFLIKQNVGGIYHVVGSQSLSPYDAAVLIADVFGFNKSLLTKTTRAEYFKNGASRPFNLSLKNDKMNGLGIQMKSLEAGLEMVKNHFRG